MVCREELVLGQGEPETPGKGPPKTGDTREMSTGPSCLSTPMAPSLGGGEISQWSWGPVPTWHGSVSDRRSVQGGPVEL